MRPGSPGWGYQPPPQLYPRRRPELGGVAVLLVVTVLAALAAPHARTLRGLVVGELAELPAIGRPAAPQPLAAMAPGPVGQSRSRWASGASPTAGAPKAPAPSTAQG